MSSFTAGSSLDIKSDEESLIGHQPSATGLFQRPEVYAEFPSELTDCLADHPLDEASGPFFRPPRTSDGFHQRSHASPQTAGPPKSVHERPSVTNLSSQAVADCISCLHKNAQMNTQMNMRILQQLLPGHATRNQRVPGMGQTSGRISQRPQPVSPSPTSNDIRSHLGGDKHRQLISPSSVNRQTVRLEENSFKQPSGSQVPSDVAAFPQSHAPQAGVGTKRKNADRACTGKRKRVDFKSLQPKTFDDFHEALTWLEKPCHPIFLQEGTHTNKKHKVTTHKCRANGGNPCRVQMKVPLGDTSKKQPTEVRLHLVDSCRCMDQRQTSNRSTSAKRVVPAWTRKITRRCCEQNPQDRPETIFRKVFKVIEKTPHLGHIANNAEEREKLKKQVKNMIPALRKEMVGGDFLRLPMQQDIDLKTLRDLHPFKLPSARLDLPESVVEASNLLFAREPNCIVVNTNDLDAGQDPKLVRHKLFTVLDGRPDPFERDQLSEAEKKLHERIDFLADRDGINDPWAKVICHTSLALLWNLKDCASLDFNVMGAADGTHSTTATGEMLLVFGCFDVKCHTFVRTFRPFIHIVCPVENELYFSIMVVTLLKYARRLLGLSDFNFHGMLVSDRAEAFVNTWKNAFPHSKPAQCFTHIIRKFKQNDKRKGWGNGTCRSDYDPANGKEDTMPAFVLDDVNGLSNCLTKPQFLCLWEMIKIEWEKEGGLTKIKDKFHHSHIQDDSHNNWFVGASGIVCCHPDNNPTEQCNLDMKGTSQRDGACEVKKSLPAMVQVQHPKAVHLASDGTMVRRNLQIESKGLGDNKSKKCKMLMAHAKNIRPWLDMHQTAEDCFHMNTCFSLDERPLEQHGGHRNRFSVNPFFRNKEPQTHDTEKQKNEWKRWLTVDVEDHRCVSTERIRLYEDCLLGKTCFKPEDRRMFMRSVWSLCKVKKRTGNGVTGHSGSCAHFLKNGHCVHAAYIRHLGELGNLHEEIDGSGHPMTTARTTTARMKKHLRRLSRHVERSQSCVEGASKNVDLLVAQRWKELKTSLRNMANALTHICTKVLPCDVTKTLPSDVRSEPVNFNPKRLKTLRKISERSVVLHTIAIELWLEAKQMCFVRRTRNTSGDADPQQMSTIERHVKKCLVEIRELHHQLKLAADANGKDVIGVCSV